MSGDSKWRRRLTWQQKKNGCSSCRMDNYHTETHGFADEGGGDVHALELLAVAAASTSVDRHAWGFKEGVGGCPKLFPHL